MSDMMKKGSGASTMKQPIPLPNNNRLYHRESVAKAARTTNHTSTGSSQQQALKGKKKKSRRHAQDGFQYAIQPDGRLLGEHVWEEHKSNPSLQQQQQPTAHGSQMIWSLQKLQAELGASRTRYEQRRQLPSEPEAKPKASIPLYEAPTPSEVPSSSSALISNTNFVPPQKPPLQKENPQPNFQSSHSNALSHSSNPYSKMGPSPSAGIHNSYSTSNAGRPPPPQSKPPYSNPPPPRLPQTFSSNPQPTIPRSSTAMLVQDTDEFDDGLDDVLATIDEEALLSASSQAQKKLPPPRRVTNEVIDVDEIYDDAAATGFDYGDYSNSSFANNNNRFQQSNNHAMNPPSNQGPPLCPGHNAPCCVRTSQSAANPGRQFYTCSMPSREDQCEFFQWTDDTSGGGGPQGQQKSSFQQSSYNNHSVGATMNFGDTAGGSGGGGVPCCPGHNLPCAILTSRSAKNPNRQFYKCSLAQRDEQCEFFEWVDESGNNNSGDSYGGNYNDFNTTGQESSSSFYNDNSSSNMNPYGDSFNANVPADTSSGAPLCPEHNLPCIILTSRSATNPNRQFYKCSMPQQDQKCDFFEWVDGDNTNSNDAPGFSTNWNDNQVPSGPPPPPLTGCKDIHVENRRIFGHPGFRPGQQGIIEQAVAGKDVFVLMPTGGGKSLCYQLPAWCCPGLSVIISPLLSLIQDQVQAMNKQGVNAVFLNSSQDYETEQKEITRKLNATSAHDGGIKLLYLTPEKLRNSNMMQGLLARLYQKNLLSRFVVDEAHCLSDWGHDFRPDYNALHFLRESYPSVPLMALTATANEKVVQDAIRALRMKPDCYRYKSSFNRPNLHYEVRKKDSKAEDSICDYIVQQYKDNSHVSGVIYCLSRKDCEKLSEKLQEKLNTRGMRKIKVSYYHADLDAGERERRHLRWSNGSLSVLCATIAFGMGIDKPDVRFVIHYSMPKSITHYYQESGRAGRDGEKADCILYYSYKDKQVLEGMIRKSAADRYGQSTKRKIDQLHTCLRYCENDFECRRTMQLQFFGESFSKSKCKGTCDNCRAGREIDKRDLTDVATALLNLLKSVHEQKKNGPGVTLLQLTELFRGSKAKNATKFLNLSQLEGYGSAAKYDLKKKQDIDRVAHAMIFERILEEISQQNKQGFSSDYVKAGAVAPAICNGRKRFHVDFPKALKENAAKPRSKSPPPKKKKKAATARKKRTSSSSASATAEAKKIPEIVSVFDDSDDEDDEEAEFQPDDDDDEGEEEPSDEGEEQEAYPVPSSVLPPAATLMLQKRIRKVVGMWASEEQMMGNNVYYWHIMKNEVIKTVAAQCPTTLEELKDTVGLGEQKFKEYGERLIKNIQNFVQTEKLEPYIEKKQSAQPAKKRKADESLPETQNHKLAKAGPGGSLHAPSIYSDDDDEFPMDIDLNDIVLPGDKKAAS